jgi:hypothetical protein
VVCLRGTTPARLDQLTALCHRFERVSYYRDDCPSRRARRLFSRVSTRIGRQLRRFVASVESPAGRVWPKLPHGLKIISAEGPASGIARIAVDKDFMKGHVVQDTTTSILLPAMETNFYQFFANFARWPQAELHEGPKLTCLLTRTPLRILNGVLRVQLSIKRIDENIEGVLDRFRQSATPMTWHTGPSTRPTDLGTYLGRHGLTLIEDLPWMAADLHALKEKPPTPMGLTIHEVTDSESRKLWLQTFGLVLQSRLPASSWTSWATSALGVTGP